MQEYVNCRVRMGSAEQKMRYPVQPSDEAGATCYNQIQQTRA